MRKQSLAAILSLAPLLPPHAAATETVSPWALDVVPYVWAADLTAETSVPGEPPSTPSAANRFETRIRAGAMVAAQVRYRAVGLFTDFAWLRLDSASLDPGPAFQSGRLQSDFIHATAALTYRLPLSGGFHAEVLAGARLWHVSEEVEYTGRVLPGFRLSGEATWVDPVIGASARYDLSGRWSLVARGMFAGFGVAADESWEAYGGATYRITPWCSVEAGYRYLLEDYDRDQFALQLTAHGFLVGVGFHF